MLFQLGDSITARTTRATKRSPNWMSCGFSSERMLEVGVTKLTGGSLPRRASA